MAEHRQFDPQRHGKDAIDELANTLHRAAPDTHIELPDKTSIHKTRDVEYHVLSRSGRKLGRHKDPEKAAKHVLDMSAQSHHRYSVGGGKAHPTFGMAMRHRAGHSSMHIAR